MQASVLNKVGISVLIPAYNFPVALLVRALVAQMPGLGKQAEIIVLDDGSDPSLIGDLQSLQSLSYVSIHSNSSNQGRMAARLKLASLAKHDYLLFLDGDSEIIKNNFIASYFSEAEKGSPLVSGGRVYQKHPPADCSLRLHWKYGTKRENNKNRHGHAFMSNNFLVKKELFQSLDHSHVLQGYGHEDSWWGMQFEKKGIDSKTIDNPVLHGSLENAESFLRKAESAVENIRLLKQTVDEKEIKKNIRIYRFYKKLKSVGLASIFLIFEKPFHKKLRRNLLSCNPSLFYFDCYRLAELIRKDRQ